MGINLAGIDLPLVDVDEGLIEGWLQRWLPLSDLRIVSEWPTATFSNNRHTIPLVNYPRPLVPRISTWYYPTGAARWGFGLFLCDIARASALGSILGLGNQGLSPVGPVPLVLTNLTNTRTFAVYVLPPRSIGTDVFVIPVVDQRWFWQFITPGGISFDDTRQWTDIIGVLSNAATGSSGAIITDTPSASYLQPNPWFYSDNGYQPVGPLLDATLHSIGFRLIDNNSGSWYAASAQTSLQNHVFNVNNQNVFIVPSVSIPVAQGGQQTSSLNLVLPQQINLNFRYYNNGVVEKNWASGQKFVSMQSSAYNVNSPASGFTLTLRSTALADCTGGLTTPANNTNLIALGNQVAQDFYTMGSYPIDVSIPGVSTALPSGLYDYFEFCMGEFAGDGPAFYTRIHGVTANMICPDMFHWDNTTWEYGSVISGILNGTLAANGTAAMKVSVATGVPIIYSNGALPPYPDDTAFTVTVTDIHNAGFASGKRVTAMQLDAFNARGSNQALGTWIVIAGQC